jgi:non-heme chloroperoxidase
MSPIPPFLVQTDDNPEGQPGSLFEGFMESAKADVPSWMKGFLDDFYNMDVYGGKLVSEQAFQASWNIAGDASATPTGSCPSPTPAGACRM